MANPDNPLLGWVKENKPIVLLLGLLALFVFGSTGHCGANRVGKPLTSDQRRLLSEPPLPYKVAVVPWTIDTSKQKRLQKGKNRLSYAENLVERLKDSGAFQSVILDTAGTASVDLLAESVGFYCNSAIIPIWTIVTLGFYPTIWDERDCVGVKFRPGNDFANTYPEPVFVSFSQESRSVMGWPAVALGLAPGWANGEMHKQGWYNDLFRLEILQQRDVITKAAQR